MSPAKKIIFLHHSVGANLIKEGALREHLKLKLPDFEFWDHNYNLFFHKFALFNHTGLTDDKSFITKTDYAIPKNNTNPDGLAEIFSQLVTNPARNTFSHLIKYDVIILKSCYPVTKISSQSQLEDYKKNYLKIRKRTDKFPNKLFILFTPPPLRSFLTKPEYARKAKEFADWLKSGQFLERRRNLKVFDLFNLLSDGITNTLRKDFCRVNPFDSHPNLAANKEIALIFIDFLAKLAF
ncbi:hypothetical protein HY025_02000 [Candidatus Daviesbacteria bacterium]|nr:hypothetical protein [Candidatus Daviesbacteria bacterium]